MGLSLEVGILADLREHDPEGAEVFEGFFEYAGAVLHKHRLPQHAEPRDCEVWSAQMYGYSGLHYLRRIAAHLDAGLAMPPPGDQDSSDDPILQAYFQDVVGQGPGLLKRLVKGLPRFSRSFDHLIVHSDAEGFYLPMDFPDVLLDEDDQQLPGGMLGSVPRLARELDRLASALGIPDHLHAEAEELWAAADAQGSGTETWQRYGIESFSCVVLREACQKSLASGAALVFC